MTVMSRRLAVVLVCLVAIGLAVSAWFADRLRVSVDAMTVAEQRATVSINKLALLQEMTEARDDPQTRAGFVEDYRQFSLERREQRALEILEHPGNGEDAREARQILLDAARNPDAGDEGTVYTRDVQSHARRVLGGTAGGAAALAVALLLLAGSALGRKPGVTNLVGVGGEGGGVASRKLILLALPLVCLGMAALGGGVWLALGAEQRAERALVAWKAGTAHRDSRIDLIRVLETGLADSGRLRGLVEHLQRPQGAKALTARLERLSDAVEEFENLDLSAAEGPVLASLRMLLTQNRELLDGLAPGGRDLAAIDAAIASRQWPETTGIETLRDILLEVRVEHEARFLINAHEAAWNTRIAWPVALAGLAALLLALPLLVMARLESRTVSA